MADDDPGGSHQRYVAAWLAEHASGDVSTARVARLLLRGLGAIASRARTSLGEVTLAAIFERVIATTRSGFPVLDTVKLRLTETGAFEVDGDAVHGADAGELLAATRVILVELLQVLGRLTGETLTAGLHAALSATDIDGSTTKKERDPS